MNKVRMWGILAFFLIVSVVTVTLSYSKAPSSIPIDTQDQPTMGNTEAPVHVVAFEDLKCKNSKEYGLKVFPHIKEAYIDTGRIKYTLVPLAFISGSKPAANAALAVFEQNHDLFFNFVKIIFEHQQDKSIDWATPDHLAELAALVPGIDIARVKKCIIECKFTMQIDKNMQVAQNAMGDNFGTPTLYVDGVLVPKASKEKISNMIEAALERKGVKFE